MGTFADSIFCTGREEIREKRDRAPRPEKHDNWYLHSFLRWSFCPLKNQDGSAEQRFPRNGEEIATGPVTYGLDCCVNFIQHALISSEQPKPPERLLNRRDLFWRARILFGRGSGCGEAEQLLAVQQPYALGHEAMLARDPLLDFLIRGTWTDRLLIAA